MPEETIDVQTAVDRLSQYGLDNHISRVHNYNIMLQALKDDQSHVSEETLEKLLAVCDYDMTSMNMKYTINVLNIIQAILSKVKMGSYEPVPALTASLLAIISVLNKIALLMRVESIVTLCFETIILYPDETMIAVAEKHHEQVMELLSVYCQLKVSIENQVQIFNILLRLLKILPPEKKRVFVEKGLPIWFSKIIPTIMNHMSLKVLDSLVTVEVLEMLTDDLIHLDYKDNPQWQSILECICNTKQYPAILKSLVDTGNDAWYRLWMAFIRMLKHQITQPISSVGTPVNSILPVVEAAFKLDVRSRCKAFECWNVLIDSFSTETVESNVNKRLKLLIIPLKANNAKTEETALAKFNSWWNLLRKFQNRMDKFLDVALVSFLHFCFGRHNAEDKTAVVPGQLSAVLKKQCNQALVNMVGHVNCSGCTDLPKLTGKLISTKHLVDHWNSWIYSLTSVIMKTATCDSGLTKQQLTCLWKSFLKTIGELPENNIRKDLFAEMLSIISHLVQECKSNNRFLDIAFNVLILSLFDEDTKIKHLFTMGNDPNEPIIRILRTILDSPLYGFYKSVPPAELTTKLQPITKLLLDEGVSNKKILSWLLIALPANDFALHFWNALAKSMSDIEYDKSPSIVCELLMWPLKSLRVFSDIKDAANTWYTTYNVFYPKLYHTNIEEIAAQLSSIPHFPISTVYFKLCVVLARIKQRFTVSNGMVCKDEFNMLVNLTKCIDSYDYFKEVFPLLIERIVVIMTIVTTYENLEVAARILICVKNILSPLAEAYKRNSDVSHVLTYAECLIRPLEKIFTIDSYATLVSPMIHHLIKFSKDFANCSELRKTIISVLKILLTRTPVTDPLYNKMKSAINDNKNCKSETTHTDQCLETNNFSTPLIKEIPKKIKKKEPNIVNTVVENGEEYVVVKSNWKFNPRKLTENQKEKLQRKREDIPALYQDLSQSQDEFKLAAWKMDSQDTTSSSRSESKSSKPCNFESDTEILKNLPNTNVVPKILGNIFSENDQSKEKDTDKKDVATASLKDTKSPRMALKDRVFRNVRSLIEGSGLHKENKDLAEVSNKTDNNINKTPTQTKNYPTASVVNSAPPLLSADRPSRVKRKPKKFQDLALLPLKKSRHSLQGVQSDNTKHVDGENFSKNDLSTGEADIAVNRSTTGNKNSELDNLKQSHNAITDMDIAYACSEVDNNSNNENISKINSNITDNFDKDQMVMIKENVHSTLDIDVVIDYDDKNVVQSKIIILKQSENAETGSTSELSTKISTPKIPKEVEEKSTPREFINSLDLDPVEAMSTSKTPTDVKEVSTPKTDNDTKDILTSKTSEDVKEISTPKISEDLKEISTPKTSKAVKEVSTLNKDRDVKELQTPITHRDVKEVSTPKTSKNEKDASTGKSSKVTTPKGKDALTVATEERVVTINNNVGGKGLSTSNRPKADLKNIATPMSPEGVIDLFNKTSKNINLPISGTLKVSYDMTTSKEAKDVKELSSPNLLNDVKVVLAGKQSKEAKELSTPKQSPKGDESKSTAKKNKKSRIEKELAIDTVEGHPYLKMKADKRMTRKALESVTTGRRKSLAEKLNKSKFEGHSKRKEKNKESEHSSPSSVVVVESQDSESQEQSSSSTNELPDSDDVIESSQDSSMTTISVKSTRKTPKKVPVVYVENVMLPTNKIGAMDNSQSILECINLHKSTSSNQENKDDSALPLNKTVLDEKTQDDLTENMDTEPLDEKEISKEIVSINKVVHNISRENSIVGPETQELAEADTQPTDLKQFMDIDVTQDDICENSETPVTKNVGRLKVCNISLENDIQSATEYKAVSRKSSDENNTENNTTVTLSESACAAIEQSSGASSPFKDEAQRQQDFLNNTIEISPIKTMSPEHSKKSPSPETSTDYVVIKLTSPVQSNGEPFDKCGSPEVFTEDKVSPDKRDQSPPRVEISVVNTSPSSSLSLKKNRPQVRNGGRAAQMLGLCVPDKVQAIVNPERNESEEVKKASTNTPARRNLRILYNSVSDNTENVNSANENDDSENFLKFRRSLPAVDSSPSGPILKRKLAEITDDTMISPASKRKRVSFHDPPVSTTISVQRYIEPGAVRSPQNSATKRLERQLRQRTPLKSPKRLDNVFKLDTVLTKTVESFSENDVVVIPYDTEHSLEETPEVEVVRVSELNDTDPICPELLDCKDPIDNIASELSCTTMKTLLIKELEGKIETVGDLAKLTELEVNRLCIKAPKVKVAKKVLTDYSTKRSEKVGSEISASINEAEFDEPMTESVSKGIDTEMQTDKNVTIEMEVQTMEIPTRICSVQTETVHIAHSSTQSEDSGSKSTADIIKSCLAEKPDFMEQLNEQLDESSIRKISEKLPLSAITDLLTKKITPSDTKCVLNRIFEQGSNNFNNRSKELTFIKDYLCERFTSKDLILLCSEMLKVVYDKPA